MTDQDKISEQDQQELDKFKDFLDDIKSHEIHKQLEKDIKSGKLDSISHEVLEEHQKGNTKSI